MSLSDRVRDWLIEGLVVRLESLALVQDWQSNQLLRIEKAINKLGGMTMAAIDDLNAAIAAQYDELLPALSEVDSELRRVRGLLADGASAEDVANALANVNSSTNRIKSAVSGLVASDSTPNPDPALPNVPVEPLPEDAVEVPVSEDNVGDTAESEVTE